MKHLQQNLRLAQQWLNRCETLRVKFTENSPTWSAFHCLQDAWERVFTLSRRVFICAETHLLSPDDQSHVQRLQERYVFLSTCETQDALFRKQLWRWAHQPAFKKLTASQQDCVRSTLAGTAVAKWPQYKKRMLNQLVSEQDSLEFQFKTNVNRDQLLFGVYLERLGELRALPKNIRMTAKSKALSYGWRGWWFEANELNATAFKSVYVPTAIKRHMTLERQKVGASGSLWHEDNTLVLRRLAQLRRQEAALYGASSYGSYAWESNVHSTPKKMATFLKKEAECVKGQRFSSPLKSLQTRYQALTCTPEMAQKLLLKLWETWFGISASITATSSHTHSLTFSRQSKVLGVVHFDLYRRAPKPSGGISGFMVDLQRPYRFSNGKIQKAEASVIMHTDVLRWSHRDVLTYFHEMGHVLHLLASPVGFSTSAWDNIEGDAIEWPSMFMETWGWDSRVTHALFSDEGQNLCRRMKSFEHKHALNVGLQVAWMDWSMHSSRCTRDDNPSVWTERMVQHSHGAHKLPKQDYARWEHLSMMRGTYAGYLWGQKTGHLLHAKLKHAQPSVWNTFWSDVLAPGGTQYASPSIQAFLQAKRS